MKITIDSSIGRFNGMKLIETILIPKADLRIDIWDSWFSTYSNKLIYFAFINNEPVNLTDKQLTGFRQLKLSYEVLNETI